VGHEVGARSIERDLEDRAEKRSTADRRRDQHGIRRPPYHQQKAGDCDGDESQHHGAAEPGHVLGRARKPARSDRHGEIGRIAQGKENGAVECAGIAFDHLVAERDNRHQPL